MNATDAEFLRVLNQRLATISTGLTKNSTDAAAAMARSEISTGVHALRARSDANLYFETDRNAMYVLTGPNRWTFVGQSQPITGTLAQMLASGLTTLDAGLKWRTTDYRHTHVWSGSAWAFDGEDDGSHYFRLDTAAPNVGLWHACDGAVVNFCDGTGALTAITLPNLGAGDIWPVFGAAYTGTPAAEVQGTLLNLTDLDGAHTHSASTAGGTTGTPSAATTVQSGTGVSVASVSHTHAQGTSTSGATDSQGAHTHGLTAARTTGSRPPKLVMVLYFRQ